MNEFFQDYIGIWIAIGFISTFLVPITWIVGIVGFIAYLFTDKSRFDGRYFLFANISLLISMAIVWWFALKMLSAGTGSVSGLMIPMFMPFSQIFCILYVLLAAISKGK